MTGSNLVGRTHARQMDTATDKAWKAEPVEIARRAVLVGEAWSIS
jgi:hypothetical protein